MSTVKLIEEIDTTAGLARASREEVVAAEFYQDRFVPALFAPWSPQIIDAAGIAAGHRVLDIGCGTGQVTRDVAAITGPQTPPLGLDLSTGMLQVAQALGGDIEWQLGDAVNLPFSERSFDRVLCQFGLMFFTDRVRALQEMRRVLRPGGRLAVSVWDDLEHNPGYAEKVRVLQRVAGQSAADALRAPFNLGDREELAHLASQAGLQGVTLTTHSGHAHFKDLAEFVDVDLLGWLPVMGEQLDPSSRRRVHEECAPALRRYEESPGGPVVLPASAHFLCAEA